MIRISSTYRNLQIDNGWTHQYIIYPPLQYSIVIRAAQFSHRKPEEPIPTICHLQKIREKKARYKF